MSCRCEGCLVRAEEDREEDLSWLKKRSTSTEPQIVCLKEVWKLEELFQTHYHPGLLVLILFFCDCRIWWLHEELCYSKHEEKKA